MRFLLLSTIEIVSEPVSFLFRFLDEWGIKAASSGSHKLNLKDERLSLLCHWRHTSDLQSHSDRRYLFFKVELTWLRFDRKVVPSGSDAKYLANDIDIGLPLI